MYTEAWRILKLCNFNLEATSVTDPKPNKIGHMDPYTVLTTKHL